jgi:Zn-dependent protease with chaperone function
MAMTRTRSIRSRWRLLLVAPLLGLAGTLLGGDPDRRDGRITRLDIATRDDLLLAHLVAPSMVGEIQQWSKQLLGGLPGQVGDWVTQFIDATAMTNIITEAFPVEGQPGFRPVDEVAAECARILGGDKPEVYLRNSPQTRIYTVHSGGRYHLVITSALLNLFENRPGELKFVVGRELGHIKCEHPELKRKGYAVLSAIQAINVAVVPDRYQDVLPLLALGRLLTWCREAEFSADRAGLLCCGEPKVAYEAIMRLQHGSEGRQPVDRTRIQALRPAGCHP